MVIVLLEHHHVADTHNGVKSVGSFPLHLVPSQSLEKPPALSLPGPGQAGMFVCRAGQPSPFQSMNRHWDTWGYSHGRYNLAYGGRHKLSNVFY